jgi:hypothetical protein
MRNSFCVLTLRIWHTIVLEHSLFGMINSAPLAVMLQMRPFAELIVILVLQFYYFYISNTLVTENADLV